MSNYVCVEARCRVPILLSLRWSLAQDESRTVRVQKPEGGCDTSVVRDDAHRWIAGERDGSASWSDRSQTCINHSRNIAVPDEVTPYSRVTQSLVRAITLALDVHESEDYIEEAEFLADRVAFLDKGEIVKVDTPQNFMDRIGKWALDDMVNNNIKTIYFKNKDEAGNYIKNREGSFTFRRVNLEDAFVSLTGKKVDI